MDEGDDDGRSDDNVITASLRDNTDPERFRSRRDLFVLYGSEEGQARLLSYLHNLISGDLSTDDLLRCLDTDIAAAPGGDKAAGNFIAPLRANMERLQKQKVHIVLNWCGICDHPRLTCDPASTPEVGFGDGKVAEIPATEAFVYGIASVLDVPIYSTELFQVFEFLPKPTRSTIKF